MFQENSFEREIDLDKPVYKEREQERKKREKIRRTLELYKTARNLTELAQKTGYSTSSLQRYLKEDSHKYLSEEEYREVVEWLNTAKIQGRIKGGVISQEEHGYAKDEHGKFQGKGK